MISRLSAIAATFAVLATATLTFAAAARQDVQMAPAAAKPVVRIVQLDPVVVTAKRLPVGVR
jgi:Flp pilus assembly protein CpaB